MSLENQTDLRTESSTIDESLYSRQIVEYGVDAMSRMAKAKILVSGLGGLGIEIVKNVILGGVKSLTMHDTRGTQWHDLSSQYYLTESDIGSNRATASLKHVSDLNPYVDVNVLTTTLTTEEVSKYNVVVLTETESDDKLLEISDFCHANKIALIYAQTIGLFGRIFCDFGDAFVVSDPNGKPPVSAFVVKITKAKQGVVICHDAHPHGLFTGDLVRFSEVLGMTEINERENVKIKVIDPYSFEIDMDTSEFSDYVCNGKVTQVKEPKTFSFKSFRDSEPAPKFVDPYFFRDGYLQTVHTAYAALQKFTASHNCYPKSWDEEDASKFIKLAQQVNRFNKNLNLELLKTFSFVARGNIAPINGVVGGVTAQEVMKACSGKFTPINQWMYFDATDCLPDPLPSSINPSDYLPTRSRYDGQIAVLGKSYQDLLSSQRWFIVGSGAIGCELLKNFAMMGVGNLIVTDMDSIEKSNLNRQFLFRSENVGQNKATAAKATISRMNPSINITAHDNRVGRDSENVYGDEFFESLNGVANALDNVVARLYVDRRCIYYRKPLLESGTIGTKGNTQVILPFKTESYGSFQEPPKDDIPLCTLKSFPSAIEHTLEWARDLFDGLFKKPMDVASSFLLDNKVLGTTLTERAPHTIEMVSTLHDVLAKKRPSSFQDCVTWARLLWEDLFANDIKQLLHNFPPDSTTSTGLVFWQAPKRCPTPLQFDLNDDLHIGFVYAAANLKADVHHIERQGLDSVRNIVNKVVIPEFIPRDDVSIATTEEENTETQASWDETELDALVEGIRSVDLSEVKLSALEFEKDDDQNLHIDFIHACSNLRATNYSIKNVDRFTSKLIAGKIIPAIATTTSVVAGLVGLELFKLVQGHKELKKYRSTFVNLALPRFAPAEPAPCPINVYSNTKWSLWDRFDVEGEITLKQFIDYFATEKQLEVTMLSQNQGEFMLYSFFMQDEDKSRLYPMTITQIIREMGGGNIESNTRHLVLELCCNDMEGEDVKVPYVRYSLPQNQ